MVVYKLVIDMMERYYTEFDGPLFKKLRTQLIPFARGFYKKLSKEDFEVINKHLEYFKSSYQSKIGFLIYSLGYTAK